jgi:hypothetical protein
MHVLLDCICNGLGSKGPQNESEDCKYERYRMYQCGEIGCVRLSERCVADPSLQGCALGTEDKLAGASSAEGNNEWRYTSTAASIFMVRGGAVG